MSTFMAKAEDVERKWYVIDADGMTLGRLASETAKILRGKNKPIYTPYVDTGDYVIIVNAAKVKVTGKKLEQKVYFRHSDYVGGAKYTTLKEMLQKKPEKVVVSFRSLPEDADRWRSYADRKGLKFEAFFRFAADEYMKNHGDD